MASKLSTKKSDTKLGRSVSNSARSRSTGAAKAAPAKPAEAKPAAATEPPAEPKKPVETVSLIEPKKKKVRTAATEGAAAKRALPPITRFGVPVAPAIAKAESSSEPEPTPEPEVVEAEVVPEVVEVPEVDPNEGKRVIHIKPPIIVKELAAQLEIKPFQLIADLMEMSIFASITQTIEPDVASKVCEKHGAVFEREKRKTGEGVHKPEVVIAEPAPPELPEDPESDLLAPRPPIITFMGHVDHGKTSLLDALRKSRVTAGEAGGITQHIGAYSIDHDGAKLTLLDTPGHAAFTSMRARGANVTDIVVLVVAADDGLMPQTIEAINHAKAANVTILVAINKIDLPGANPDRVKGQLQEHGLTPEDWGGETICCEVSATKGTGIDNLISNMQLQAEVLELTTDAKTDARCTVIEAQLEPGRGPTATVIVRMGTLKAGQAFICGNYSGKVKQLINDLGKPVKEAPPSMPVKVLGFSGLPKAGDELVVMESEKTAKLLSDERLDELRTAKLTSPRRTTLESLFDSMEDSKKKVLAVVVKADVQGTLEAIVTALEEIQSEKISLKVLHSAVGPITESDVMLASASDAVIIGFGIKVEASASGVARREGVQIKLFSIIYELIDQVKESMTGMLDPELREQIVGHAEVKQVFNLSKGRVAGCLVIDGRIPRNARARVLRKRQPIYDGGVATLRRFQDEVKEVRNGLECGIKLGDFTEYEPGDIIEAYLLEKFAQTL